MNEELIVLESMGAASEFIAQEGLLSKLKETRNNKKRQKLEAKGIKVFTKDEFAQEVQPKIDKCIDDIFKDIDKMKDPNVKEFLSDSYVYRKGKVQQGGRDISFILINYDQVSDMEEYYDIVTDISDILYKHAKKCGFQVDNNGIELSVEIPFTQII